MITTRIENNDEDYLKKLGILTNMMNVSGIYPNKTIDIFYHDNELTINFNDIKGYNWFDPVLPKEDLIEWKIFFNFIKKNKLKIDSDSEIHKTQLELKRIQTSIKFYKLVKKSTKLK